MMVSAAWGGSLRVWDTITWQERTNFQAHTAWISSAVFLPNGKIVATASADQRIKLWDTADWSLIAELKGHLHEIWALATIAVDTCGSCRAGSPA
jgi:WD40 repeat protein